VISRFQLAQSFPSFAAPAHSGQLRQIRKSELLSFHTLANSFAQAHSTTPLQSIRSALFSKNTGGGYIPQNLLRVFKHLQTVAPIHAARMEFIPMAVASLSALSILSLCCREGV